MFEHNSYTIAFKCDEELILSTQKSLHEVRGEPHDTARIFLMAVKDLQEAAAQGEIAENTLEIVNLVVIDYPDGQSRSFTDKQIGALLDEYADHNKYKATRNDRVLVTLQGGFMGGLIKNPVDVNLEALNEEDFTRVAAIVDLLQTRNVKLDKADWCGDFGYYVRIGDMQTEPEDMKLVFSGGPFSKTPVVVEELETILGAYVVNPQRRPRRCAQLKGPAGPE